MKKLLLALACFAAAASSQPAEGFDYYLLSMSWAPDFCALPSGNKDPRECGRGRQTGFVVHGLWPQGDQGRGPERCGHPRPVAERIVQTMLNYIPTDSLIQHEWTNHGSCTGLSAEDYFAQVRRARDSVQIPKEFQAPQQPLDVTPQQVETQFAAAIRSSLAARSAPRAHRARCRKCGCVSPKTSCRGRAVRARANARCAAWWCGQFSSGKSFGAEC